MKYEAISKARIQTDYLDNEFETVMTFDLRREDGEIGTEAWFVAGVPAYHQGSSKAAGHQSGFEEVRAFGDSPDSWCPPNFDADDKDEMIEAVRAAALKAHRDRYYSMSR